MRFQGTAKGEVCIVEVEIGRDRVRATVFPQHERTILSVYDATIETSYPHLEPDPEVFPEQVARDAIADFEIKGAPGTPLTAYAGQLRRLS